MTFINERNFRESFSHIILDVKIWNNQKRKELKIGYISICRERETAVKVGWMGGIEKKLNNNQIRH